MKREFTLIVVVWLLGAVPGYCFYNPRCPTGEASTAAATKSALQYRDVVRLREVIRATDPKATALRASTKYHDNETDLLFYGYRYYNASTGRWISRDPIGERGGENLYGFVRNASISRIDFYGLEDSQTFKPICDMAKRLQREIDKLPQTSLKRPFLQTQECILNRLCNGHCCPNASSASWLNATARDFMNPLFDALAGNPNQRWKDTFNQIDQWQKEIDTQTRPIGGDTAPLVIGEAMNEEADTLQAARAMALTHINQDLRQALVNNTVGLDSDWKCVGSQVSDCQKKFFNWLERLGSWSFGFVWHSFDVSRFREDMRNDLKNPGPPPTPIFFDDKLIPYEMN